MTLLETRRGSGLSAISDEDSVTFDHIKAPASPPNQLVSQDSDLSNTNIPSQPYTHHRRDSSQAGPHLDKFLRLFDIIDCPNDVMCCKFTPDGSLLAIGLIDGIILIYNHHLEHDSQLLYSLQDEDILKNNLPVTQIRFPVFPFSEEPEENRLLASYASGHIKLWHYPSGQCLNTLTESRQSLNVAYNPDGRRFITTGETPEIFVYDRETRQKINVLEPRISRILIEKLLDKQVIENRNTNYDAPQKLDGHCFRVFAAQYHPDEPHLFLSGGWDDTVHYWDDRRKHSIRSISGPHICGDALDIDPISKKQVLTGSWRRKCPLEVWDFDTGRKIKDIPSEPNCHCQLYCCQWLAKESVLCGGSDGNMAKVINLSTLSTKGLLTDLPQGVYCIDNDRNGAKPLLAVGSKSKIFLLKPEKDF